jgi:hypothetical protein
VRTHYLKRTTVGAMTAFSPSQLTCTHPRIGEKAFAGLAGGKKVLQRSRGRLTVRTVGLVHHLPTPGQGSFLLASPSSKGSCPLPDGLRTAGVDVPLFFPSSTFASCSSSDCFLTARASPGQCPTSYPVCLFFSSPSRVILPSFILPVSVVEPRVPPSQNTTLLRRRQHRYCTLPCH